ncbi:DNA excision repair protein ERCC-1 [Contarinia nasturtii]|uniref:DNA excision repair protein ERCC-1 n=1 Tax=Contarinia nasturtii TaxID=265458 RepID=UPI0012D3C563|nr:DNA excision repair protein ERCC-1 [Contarinia nasturtii]
MNSENIENDSFDDILAQIEEPVTVKSKVPSEVKKSRFSTENDDDLDSLLANITMPDEASASSTQPAEKPVTKMGSGKTNCVLVNPKQRGNPILKSITNVPWEFDDSIIPDYVVGKTSCILFLSLRYHSLNPDYIHNRLKELGKRYELRVLLVHVDNKDPNNALKNLTQMCLLADLTLMLAWNPEEAGKIVETYKSFENKPPDLIMARAQQYPHQKLVTALTNIKPVNKTDAMTLLQNYGSLKNLILTNEENLAMCSGLGPRKAKRLINVFNDPFLKK